jgi:hypothetical protein
MEMAMADYCSNFLGALASLCVAIAGAGTADAGRGVRALAEPAGRVILTVDGSIGAANAQARADFDLAMLEALPAREIATATPWTDGVRRFAGVPLQSVLEAAAAEGSTLTATAISGYSVSMPLHEAVELGAVLAYRIDGHAIPTDDKGPLWIVFPFGEKPDMAEESMRVRSAWQLRRLTVQQ